MIVEFESDFFAGTMFIVSSPQEGKKLLAEGVARGRIWSRKEIDFLKKLALEPDDLKTIVEAKVVFDARVQDADARLRDESRQ